ncbi:hypothetical protein [Acinetobacter wuhouensis]|uniref:Uncharacterized protein n=1 Tax=Acinetobacter wuhouensis TaxID=1879050 RepID=A0A3G2T201_9GAMM|nr:hypothetical protein [Acinetobacter wuhouensis]AYO54214.1 hypothetical protein CDG68_11465 [Acinetobacter wuhouensis]
MSNPLERLMALMPKAPEFVGTITSVNHPNYKVLVSDNSGLVMCTSAVEYKLGEKVFISNNEIKRSALQGTVVQIEV